MSEHFESTKKGFMHQLIVSTISKLNLVTRQEFDTQTQVLIKTRLRVEQLEQILMELQRQE
jgi:BMFP domain-containing protein YqiC